MRKIKRSVAILICFVLCLSMDILGQADQPEKVVFADSPIHHIGVNAQKTVNSVKKTNETVYATHNVNIRMAPNRSSEKMGLLCGGEAIIRTGICGNGWSRVLYDDQECYIHSDYLTTRQYCQESDSIDISNDEWISLGEFKITSYCGGTCCNGKWAGQTSTGVSPKEGRTIAVAPWVIPYGSEVKIEGLDRTYIAEDTGGFANRNDHQIDLFISDHDRSNDWGVQYRTVYIRTR